MKKKFKQQEHTHSPHIDIHHQSGQAGTKKLN